MRLIPDLIADSFTDFTRARFAPVVWTRDVGVNPDVHFWDGKRFVWSVHTYETTAGFSSLAHEVGHLIECRNYRPASLRKPDWGLREDELIGWFEAIYVHREQYPFADNALALGYEMNVVNPIAAHVAREFEHIRNDEVVELFNNAADNSPHRCIAVG